MVNLSFFVIMLFQNIPNDWVKTVLNDADSLTEDKIDEVLREFLKDFKEGSLESKGWPTFFTAYCVSKAAMNAYTKVLANKHPRFLINCVCPARMPAGQGPSQREVIVISLRAIDGMGAGVIFVTACTT